MDVPIRSPTIQGMQIMFLIFNVPHNLFLKKKSNHTLFYLVCKILGIAYGVVTKHIGITNKFIPPTYIREGGKDKC